MKMAQLTLSADAAAGAADVYDDDNVNGMSKGSYISQRMNQLSENHIHTEYSILLLYRVVHLPCK